MDGGSLGLGPHSAGFPNTGCAARTLEIGFQRSARMSERVSTLPLDQTGWIPWKVDALSRERTTRASAHNPAVLARRLSVDWPARHGWRLELLETFVETGRFKGVAYRAANWQWVGLTTGRTRQEKEHRAQAPRKSIWVYPLGKGFRERLGALDSRGGAS